MTDFARFYNSENSQPTYGSPVPDSADNFQTAYAVAFGSSASLIQAELGFIAAAASAPSKVVLLGHSFTLTSGFG